MNNSTAVIFVKAQDDVYDLLGNAIVPQDSLNHCSVHHVKCLFKVTRTDMKR